MHFGNLGLRSITPHIQVQKPIIDEERQDLKNRSWELFSGRTINWEKLGAINRVKSYLSSNYAKKVHDEFKEFIKEDLLKKLNLRRIQTYLDNNLNELENEILQTKELTKNDQKELLSLINNKKKKIKNEYFSEEQKKLINNLSEKNHITNEQISLFYSERPEFQTITTREKYNEFKAAIYEKFHIPVDERI